MRKLTSLVISLLTLLSISFTAFAQNRGGDAGEACGSAGACASCGGCAATPVVMILVIVGVIVLNIALLIWVAKDAKARGMDNAVLWMVVVFFMSWVGLIIYIYSRPKGDLVQCPNCKNNRLQASAKCPHCGNP